MEQVIVHLRLSFSFDFEKEYKALPSLQTELIEAISKAAVGESDSYWCGVGECFFYLYGPSADHLFAAIEPVLRSSPVARHGYAIKRRGQPSDIRAPEERVKWSEGGAVEDRRFPVVLHFEKRRSGRVGRCELTVYEDGSAYLLGDDSAMVFECAADAWREAFVYLESHGYIQTD